MLVVPPPITHLVVGFVKHLPQIWAEGSPLLTQRWTPSPAVWPPQLELWKVASCEQIKKDYIIKEVPVPLILDSTNSVYPYESTDVFRDKSIYTVPIQLQASISHWSWHLCPSLTLCFAAALCCHRCEGKRIYLRNVTIMIQSHLVEGSPDRKWGNGQSCVGYWVCCEWEALLCPSHMMLRLGCCDCVYYRKKTESRCRRKDGIYLPEFRRFVDSTCEFCWLTNTHQPSVHLAEPHATPWMTTLKTRFCTHGENSLWSWALFLHRISFLPLRPHAFPSKLSSSQVVATVQPSNTATNTKQWKSTRNWCHQT